VSIERIFYCDWRECGGHTRTAAARPSSFLTITGDGPALHFCTWDCALRFAAEKPPVETISQSAS
jgi:hypothetical protein